MIYSAQLSILISKAFALIPCCLFWTQLMGHLFGSWAPCRPSWRAGWWSGGQCWEGPIPNGGHSDPDSFSSTSPPPLKPSLADLDKERPKGGWAYHHEQLSCGEIFKAKFDQIISTASVWKIPTVVGYGKHVQTLLIKVVCCLAAPSGAFLSGSFMNPCSLVAFYSVTHGGQT